MEIADVLLQLDKKLSELKKEILDGFDSAVETHYLKCMNARLEADKKEERDNKKIETSSPIWYNLFRGMTAKDVVILIIVISALFGSRLGTKPLTTEQQKAIDLIVYNTKCTENVDGKDLN